MAYVKARQTRAFIEHLLHIRHVISFEAADVEIGQTSTAIEHLGHACYIISLEVAYVETR